MQTTSGKLKSLNELAKKPLIYIKNALATINPRKEKVKERVKRKRSDHK